MIVLSGLFEETETETESETKPLKKKEAPRARKERGPHFADMNVGRPVPGTVECTAWHCSGLSIMHSYM